MDSGKIKFLKDTILNILSNERYKLSYIVEIADWSIKADGKYITSSLNNQKLINSRITTSYLGIRNQIVHFGSVNTFLKQNGFRKVHCSNKTVLTWFHFVPEDKRNKNILKAQKYIHFIHTSCNKTKKDLIGLGVAPEKIIVIPLGVDLDLFKPVSSEEKLKLREMLMIPKDKIVIGSFQKDGVGWGKGFEPKLIKGPDILIRAVEGLSKSYPIFVLLVGPARGYVERELTKRKIPFKSVGYLKKFEEISTYYKVLDLYFITSRIEGGPKQILEAWASGVPVVSTKVGMVPDIARDRENVIMTEIEDIDQIVEAAKTIIKDKKLRKKLIDNALQEVQNYSWQRIVKSYYEKIYSRLYG